MHVGGRPREVKDDNLGELDGEKVFSVLNTRGLDNTSLVAAQSSSLLLINKRLIAKKSATHRRIKKRKDGALGSMRTLVWFNKGDQ